jgi:hypothetical protein
MTNPFASLPLPSTGRPLSTVNQVHYALMGGKVFCELADGRIEQICQARRQKGVFQVRLLANNRWESTPRRIWATKPPVEALPSSQETNAASRILVQRDPVGERSLDDLQNMAFSVPMWLEAAEGDWVILPQFGRRRLVLKRWQQERPVLTAKTFGELVTLMRGQEELYPLLNQDEYTPLRSWQIATPAIQQDVVG